MTPSCALIAARVAQGKLADLKELPNDQRAVDARFIRQLILGLAITRDEHEAIANQQPDYRALIPLGNLAPVPVSPVGVRLQHATIDGVLDLADGCGDGGNLLPALALEECILPGGIPSTDTDSPDYLLSLDLSRARIARLSLRRSRFGQLRACGTVIEGDVDLTEVKPLGGWEDRPWPGIDMAVFRDRLNDTAKRIQAGEIPCDPERRDNPDEGETTMAPGARECCWVNLSTSRIGGEITAIGAKFRTPAPRALELYHSMDTRYGLKLDRAIVSGSLSAYGGSVFDGGLLLHLARIEGEVWLGGAQLMKGEGLALDAHCVVAGGVYAVGKPLTAHGGIYFNSARIEGNFDLKNASLDGAGGEALSATSASIGGNLHLDKGFAARGTIRLADARVDGKLNMSDSILDGGGSDALCGRSMYIGASADFRKTVARGCIWLHSARVSDALDFDGAFLCGSVPGEDGRGLTALSGTAVDIGDCIKLKKGFTAVGSVRFQRARIGKDMEFVNARISAPESEAIDIGWTKVLGILILEHNTFEGGVRLTHASAGILNDYDHGYGYVYGNRKGPLLELDGFRYESIYEPDLTKDGRSVGCTKSRIDWLKRMGDGYQPQPYAWLTRILAGQGRSEDAREIAIEKHDRQRTWQRDRILENGLLKMAPGALGYLATLLYGLMFGYGLSPMRAFKSIILVILLGWLVFWLANGRGAMIIDQQPIANSAVQLIAGSVHEIHLGAAVSDRTVADRIPCGNTIKPFLYALDVFIPLVDLRQESKCEINIATGEDKLFQGILLPGGTTLFPEVELYRYFKAFYAFSGWLIISLAIVTFSGVLQRREGQ